MKLGVKIPYSDRNASSADLKRFVRAVDDKGFDSLWLGDHLVLPEDIDPSNYSYLWRFTEEQLASPEMSTLFPEKYFLEAMVTCAFVAGLTDRMSIGVGVLVVPMRNPVQLAAQIATVDVLCHGRFIAGVGTGWAREEFRALGREQYFEPRGRVLDESIAAMRALWGKQPANFSGEFFNFKNTWCEPTPLQAGGPPIWVGGDSKRALRRTVELGNGWQPVELPPDKFKLMSRQLDEMLDAAGRDPREVRRSVSTRLPLRSGGEAKAKAIIEQYHAAGCEHLVMYSGWRNSLDMNLDRALMFHDLASEVIGKAAVTVS
jgi:probable F420-dependent oxidoreductase